MTKNPIVDEIRRIREEQAAKYRFDIQEIMCAAKKRQDKSGFKVVSFEPERVRAPQTAKRLPAK